MENASPLDPLLLSQPRLLVMSLLKKSKSVEFTELRDQTGIAPGNLSLQLKKLKEAGYVEVVKSFRDNYPLTVYKITEKGDSALRTFLTAINQILA